MEYDSQRRVVRMRDINNNIEGRMEYGSEYTRVSDPKGNSKYYGKISGTNNRYFTDRLNNTTTYLYDEDDNLVRTINSKGKNS